MSLSHLPVCRVRHRVLRGATPFQHLWNVLLPHQHLHIRWLKYSCIPLFKDNVRQHFDIVLSVLWKCFDRHLSGVPVPDQNGSDSKMQALIPSWNSDRSIMANYNTHKAALYHLWVIPNQPQQRSGLFFHSSLWSKVTVWYVEDTLLTVIAGDNYLVWPGKRLEETQSQRAILWLVD